ncbi:NAD(P)H dehydrogenase (quinone) [Paraburkholderia fungorum]|uniref:NAD(P)H dehydrogenase (Quinone) n=1 Tax=Paraburkholderia fungorum TaxID=134537 RepID=A0A1H1JV94_9BURK|nr:SDR family oxidoreductase [Paraburkholderia fungorum]SDR53760.1 NAD(P)H dehydrogenase (quinone) [Paraburkholderia fungorum]
MIAVTGANGNLGRLVIKGLVKVVPADQIVACVRRPDQVDDIRALGIQIRKADYDLPETLAKAFDGIEKVLLISAVQPGERFRQHKAVIDAAVQGGVNLIAYTSMLRADTSSLCLSGEHRETEFYLKRSGLDYVLLRNGWYLENHTDSLPLALAHGALIGSAMTGRFASASRGDYAGAAVAVLTQPGHVNKTYELVGDNSYTMSDFAAEVSKQSSRSITYNNLPAADYEAALIGLGIPKMIVDVLVDADVKSLDGELDSPSRELAALLGRNTTTLSDAILASLPTSITLG